MGKKAISNTFTVNTIDDAVTYGFVFTEAFAKADASKTITGNIKGYAYKYVGDTRTPLANTIIRYGYIIDDAGTYADTTTSNSGFFDTQGWFNGDNIDDYAKGSPSIFAAIVIGGVVVHVEYITISLQGDTGGRGKTGRFYYYAQEWSNNPNVSYAVTDAEAPYFLYNGNYWVFNPTENYPSGISMSAMGTPSSSNENWKLMVTDFKFIIAEAIFGDYAHFGSAIINGDWLLSSNGKVNGADMTKDNDITGKIISPSGNPSFSVKPYTLFDPTNPLNDHETILSSDTAITIGASATTKTIASQYLEAGHVYHLSLRGYKYTSDSQLCIRIRNSYYGSYQHTYFTTTASQYYITFKVETSATYTIELYQPTLSSSSSGGGTVTSYMLLRFLYKPAYAVDLKTGESYQTRVYASGGMRSPFSYLTQGGTFTENMSDNIGIYSTSSNSGTNYYIPCDVSQSGRKICVTNYYFNGQSSVANGWATLNMSNRGSNQYFFEDGIMKTTLKLSREGVELLGYGNETTFYGWIVIKRFDLGTVSRYGHHMKMLAVANVNVTKSGDTTSANISYHSFDGTTLSVTRNGVGIYTVSWNNSNWFASASSVFVMICGLGRTVDAGDNPIFASIKSKTSTSFVAQVADDSSLNDGSFSFFLMNFDDWVYLH